MGDCNMGQNSSTVEDSTDFPSMPLDVDDDIDDKLKIADNMAAEGDYWGAYTILEVLRTDNEKIERKDT